VYYIRWKWRVQSITLPATTPMSESLSRWIRSGQTWTKEAGAGERESGTIDGFSYLVAYRLNIL
jgi:hypothetical protein